MSDMQPYLAGWRVWAAAGLLGVVVQAIIIAAAQFLPAEGWLALPGVLLASSVFPLGVHSNHALAWIVLGQLLNPAFYTALFVGLLRMFRGSNAPPERELGGCQ